ncbi:major facilitator superfamily domain-containing protein [Pseudomassariella vexata]|uniref:Major facilitator superfamily domain-containing protein n=1 Tax=Pseudomassariella vexata TaxID=1141098 RepID=A0A1Y2DKF5_9PEZI|nr:major facilitator superfamily domain-containing protein [Pseudomassariella vexata]ORY59713.1 major facilitator superfamily domain-containing protein [Pseudomassariella vexata]
MAPPSQVQWMAPDDQRNPTNFSKYRKLFIVFAGIICTVNSGLGSSLPSGGTKYIGEHFNITSHNMLVLLNSVYMVGFTAGPLIFGPMSENLGRRPVLVGTYLAYTFFTMACALAPSYAALLIFRLLAGINASAPMSIISGVYSDIYADTTIRGQAMGLFLYITTLGPQAGPMLSGWLSPISWRWPFWAGFIIAGVGAPMVIMLPETYVPVLVQRRQKKAKTVDDDDDGADSPPRPARTRLRDIYGRPFAMLIEEPIVLSTSLYCALIYGTMYLFFQAYPIIFQDLYGMSTGESSLAYIAVILGATASYGGFLWYSPYHAKAEANGEPWAKIEEYRRLPLACAGAPLITIGLFWIAWTSYKSLNPILAMVGGFWFGFGYLLIFLSMLNYLTDVYKQFSASAQAAASTTRSIFAVTLPLATSSMYGNLGVHWATSLLGFLTLIMAVIPFAFIRYRDFIRGRSPFCQRLGQGDIAFYAEPVNAREALTEKKVETDPNRDGAVTVPPSRLESNSEHV